MDWFLYDNGLRQERVKNALNSKAGILVSWNFSKLISVVKTLMLRGSSLFTFPRLVAIAMAAKNSDSPPPSVLTVCGASQKILHKVFFFNLMNIFLSFKQLYNNSKELK